MILIDSITKIAENIKFDRQYYENQTNHLFSLKTKSHRVRAKNVISKLLSFSLDRVSSKKISVLAIIHIWLDKLVLQNSNKNLKVGLLSNLTISILSDWISRCESSSEIKI